MAVFKGDPDEHEPDSAVINRSATGIAPRPKADSG